MAPKQQKKEVPSSSVTDDLIAASDVPPEKVSWLWRGRIPRGMLSVVAGKPDQGKGLFAAHLAAEVSRRGSKVLYSAIEDSESMMTRPRLEAANARLNNIVFPQPFTLPAQLEELAAHVIENDIDFVVIDPFNAHLAGASRFGDSIRKVLTPLKGLAQGTNTAILIVEHTVKKIAKSAHPLQALGGSGSGLAAACRMAYVFGTDPADGDRRILASVKSNLRDRPKAIAFEVDSEELDIVGEVPSLVFQGETEFDASRLVTAESGEGKQIGRSPTKRAAASEWLANYLFAAGEPVRAGDVLEDAKQYQFSSKTVRRAAADMNVIKDPPGGGPNVTWALPDEVIEFMGEAQDE